MTECAHCNDTIEPGEPRRPIKFGHYHPGESGQYATFHEGCGELYHGPMRSGYQGQKALVIAENHQTIIPYSYEGLSEGGWVRYPPEPMFGTKFDINGAQFTKELGYTVIYATEVYSNA